MHTQKGQIVIVLLLTILVALAVGLTVTQRSITDITTSTQTEQSSRAFSAAQAGLEKALSQGDNPVSNIPNFDLGNESHATVNIANNLPRLTQALEYPPIGKETVAQFWLANLDTSTFDPYYQQNQFDIYFGNEGISSNDYPAIELNLVTRDSAGNYVLTKKFIDPDASRRSNNNFIPCTTLNPSTAINTTSSQDATITDRKFLCLYTFDLTGLGTPVILRARILYISTSQKIALKPFVSGACTTSCSLPPQAVIYTSTGTAGQSQKILQIFRTKVVPFFFDYAIFSTGEISK